MMRKILLTFALAASAVMTAASAQTTPPPPPFGGMMRADADGDRVITHAEYIAQAEARFAATDTNRDGKLTVEERRAAREAMRARRGNGDMPPPPASQPRPAN